MVTFSYALTQIDVSKCNLIFNLNPIVVILLAGAMLKEKVTKWDVICSIGAFLGVFIISDITGSTTEIKEEIFGISLASISALFTGLQFILMRKLNEKETVHYLL